MIHGFYQGIQDRVSFAKTSRPKLDACRIEPKRISHIRLKCFLYFLLRGHDYLMHKSVVELCRKVIRFVMNLFEALSNVAHESHIT